MLFYLFVLQAAVELLFTFEFISHIWSYSVDFFRESLHSRFLRRLNFCLDHHWRWFRIFQIRFFRNRAFFLAYRCWFYRFFNFFFIYNRFLQIFASWSCRDGFLNWLLNRPGMFTFGSRSLNNALGDWRVTRILLFARVLVQILNNFVFNFLNLLLSHELLRLRFLLPSIIPLWNLVRKNHDRWRLLHDSRVFLSEDWDQAQRIFLQMLMFLSEKVVFLDRGLRHRTTKKNLRFNKRFSYRLHNLLRDRIIMVDTLSHIHFPQLLFLLDVLVQVELFIRFILVHELSMGVIDLVLHVSSLFGHLFPILPASGPFLDNYRGLFFSFLNLLLLPCSFFLHIQNPWRRWHFLHWGSWLAFLVHYLALLFLDGLKVDGMITFLWSWLLSEI